MAYKILPPPGFKQGPIPAFYNVTMAVGPANRPNNPDDVMLVQLCLQQIFSNPTLFPSPPDDIRVVPDGKCGPITREAIWFWQTQMQYFGVSIYADGVIDRVSDMRVITSYGYSYSMFWLNLGLYRVIGDQRFRHLDVDKITPYLLGVKLGISDS